MRYVNARLQRYSRDLTYRIYVSDSLQAIANNTKYHVGADGMIEHGMAITARYYDILHPGEPQPEDTRSCEEIASDVWRNAFGVDIDGCI